jgi:glycosyltransferase involved in cell wall biosynthesis
MKRIFIIQNTPLNEPLPLSIFLTSLLKNFGVNKDSEINLIVSKSKAIPLSIQKLCYKIYQVSANTYSIKDNIIFSLKARSILQRENILKHINIIHCFYPNSSLMGAFLFKLFNNKKVKIVYDVRSPWIEMSIARGYVSRSIAAIYKFVLYFEEWFLCKWVNSFVFVTKGLADYYENRIKIKSKKRVYIIPSGVDLKFSRTSKSNIREKYRIDSQDILICSVGGIAKVRKLDDFLYLFKSVVLKNKQIKLMFIGDGDLLEKLKKITKSLNLFSNVIFVGIVPHNDIPKYISASNFGLAHLPDLFIHRNNFSLKILEYLCCNVPVLASKIDSNIEISKKLKGIHIYENSQDILDIVSQKNGEVVKQDLSNYSWPHLAFSYEKIYKELK